MQNLGGLHDSLSDLPFYYFVEFQKGVDWREHPDPRCLLAPAIVHSTRNNSSNSPRVPFGTSHFVEFYTGLILLKDQTAIKLLHISCLIYKDD